MTAYSDQVKRKCFEKIACICETLPPYCAPYINKVATRRDTSFRTGMQYAYEIATFIRYLSERDHVPMPEVPAETLDNMLPMDIDEYISHLASFETADDQKYNEALRKEKMEARASIKDSAVLAAVLSRSEKHHHRSAQAQARNLAAVRGLYKYLVKNQVIRTNPAEQADTPYGREKPVIALKPSEVKETLARVEATDLPASKKRFASKQQLRDTAIIKLLLYTGIRASECAGLDVQDVNLKDNCIRVLRKGGNTENVYFNKETAGALRDYIEIERKSPPYDKNALFVSRWHERLSPPAISEIVKKYTEGISSSARSLSAHKLRSTYATNLIKHDASLMTVRDALGHQNLASLHKYVAAAEERRKDAADLVEY